MARQFEVIANESENQQATEIPGRVAQAAQSASTYALLLGLKALSQRTLVALADLFTLLTICSAFYLWYLTPKPDAYQIISLSIYAVFVLIANWIVRGRR